MLVLRGEREGVVVLLVAMMKKCKKNMNKKNWRKEKEMHAAMHRAVINMPTNLASNWLRIGIVKSR